MLRKMATEAAARTFFSSPYFAVVGASTDPSKFGHKIFTWYTTHGLPATPINPSSTTIKVATTEYATLPSISALPHPTETGVSIITPPKITKKVLEEAKKLGVKSVWLQPGTYDEEILGYALRETCRGRVIECFLRSFGILGCWFYYIIEAWEISLERDRLSIWAALPLSIRSHHSNTTYSEKVHVEL